MPKFEIVVAREYYKSLHYIVDASDAKTAEKVDYSGRDPDGEGSLQAGEDTIIDVRPINPYPVRE